MNRITLQKVLPDIFKNEAKIQSDVWMKNISFVKGECYLVEANSGTGKSSLCSYIYGYRDDFSGEILFEEQNIRSLKKKQWDEIRCNHLSLLFQELSLFAELTAFENVQLKNNLTHYKTKIQIEEMFEVLGISNKKDSLIGKMSWGQQQRVAIIRSLCQPFDFFILDEPISHLDDENARIIAEMLSKESIDRGASIIVTSIGKHLPINYTKTFAL